jgi:hypothetical protein
MRPVDAQWPISQRFGDGATQGVAANSDPNSGTGYLVHLYGNYQPFGHAGTDIACPIGTPVHAMADGTVLWADWGTNLPGDDSDWGYRQRWYLYKGFPGIVSVIQHPWGLGVYAHLSSNDAAPQGTQVAEGQVIGYSGKTGGVAPHLHVGAIVDLNYSTGNGLIYGSTDPEPFFGSTVQAASSGSVTPIQEDDLTPEQAAQLAYIASPQFKRDIFAGDSDVERSARNQFFDDLVGHEFPWFGFDGKVPADGRQTTSIKTDVGWADARATGILNATLNAIKGLAGQVKDAPDPETAAATYDKLIELIDGTVLALNVQKPTN